jgi:methionine-rich copper-binding protein CopC
MSRCASVTFKPKRGQADRGEYRQTSRAIKPPSDVGTAMITKASITLACAIALTSSGEALAHAELHRASPEADSTISEPPHEVTLTFTDTLEAAFSSADVTNSDGVRVDEGKSQVNGNMIRIALKSLSPGSYRVHWRAVSVDTHRSEGSFKFSVSGR